MGTACAQDFGPIETRNLRSLSVPFLRFDPRGGVLAGGERTLSTGFSAANEFRRESQVQEDYELDRLLLRFRQGVGRGWDVTYDLPVLSRGGGFMDPFIQVWHDSIVTGSPGQSRNGVRYGQSYVRAPGVSLGSAVGVGDLSFSATRALGTRSMLSLGVKLPTGNAGEALGSGGFDAGFALQTRVPVVRSVQLYLQGGLVAQSAGSALPHARGLVHQEAVALGWRRNSRDHFVIQWQSEASATVTGESESDAGHRIFSVGYQRRVADGQTLEFFFSENRDWPNWPIPRLANVGPDFTAGLRWTRRL